MQDPVQYRPVRMLTDRYKNHGVEMGSVGYVIECYTAGKYEIEFSHPNGTTYAMLVIHRSEFDVLDDTEAKDKTNSKD